MKEGLKFEYQYWDPVECCRVATNVQSLNDLEDNVFMISAHYEEVEDLACKQQHLGGEQHFMDTIQSNGIDDMVPQPPIVESDGYDEIPANPPSYSRLSSSSG